MLQNSLDMIVNTRRGFLKTAGILAAGSLLMPEALNAIDKPGRKVGLQLYSVRKEMLADAAGTEVRLDHMRNDLAVAPLFGCRVIAILVRRHLLRCGNHKTGLSLHDLVRARHQHDGDW